MKLNIQSGLEDRPIKTSLYGVEGIGKSTLAAQFPNPLFIDTEGGTSRINCRRVKCASWQELKDIISEVKNNPTICETLVIDTLDKAEAFAIDYICQKNRKPNIEAFGYGAGYTILQSEVETLFQALNELINLGINVVLIAHAKARKFELPEESGSYDRYETKLTRQVAPLFKEWADLLLFANYKHYVVTSETNSKKVQGGERVIYTSHHACWDAKNRFGLPDELDLDFKSIAHLFSKKTMQKPAQIDEKAESELLLKVKELIKNAGVSEQEVEAIVIAKGHYPEGAKLEDYSEDFLARWVVPNFKKIVEAINKQKGER